MLNNALKNYWCEGPRRLLKTTSLWVECKSSWWRNPHWERGVDCPGFHFLFAFVCLFVYLFVCLFAQVFQVFTCCFLFVRFPIQLIVDVQHVNPGFWKEQQPWYQQGDSRIWHRRSFGKKGTLLKLPNKTFLNVVDFLYSINSCFSCICFLLTSWTCIMKTYQNRYNFFFHFLIPHSRKWKMGFFNITKSCQGGSFEMWVELPTVHGVRGRDDGHGGDRGGRGRDDWEGGQQGGGQCWRYWKQVTVHSFWRREKSTILANVQAWRGRWRGCWT